MVIIWSNTASSACSIHFKVIRDFLQQTQKWPKHTRYTLWIEYGWIFDRVQVEKKERERMNELNQTLIQTASDLYFMFFVAVSCYNRFVCSTVVSYFCISFAACAIIIKYANRTKTFSSKCGIGRENCNAYWLRRSCDEIVYSIAPLKCRPNDFFSSMPHRKTHRATNGNKISKHIAQM